MAVSLMAGLEPFGVIANEKAKNPHGDYKLIDTQAIFGIYRLEEAFLLVLRFLAVVFFLAASTFFR